MSQASVGIDFTLETVQYKFATIIGELCGKPSVLSQFAVWLDLRLAEYKLKGSISLDCSGLKPDPDWLQGLRESTPSLELSVHSTHTDRLSTGHLVRSRLSKDRSSAHTTSYRTGHHSTQGSPEVMVIKDEPVDFNVQDRVFPVGLHKRSHGRVYRKHSLHENDRMSHECSPSKSPRTSSAALQDSLFPSSHVSEELSASDAANLHEANFQRGDTDSTDASYHIERGGNSGNSRADNPAELYSETDTLGESISEPSLQKILNIHQYSEDQHESGTASEPETFDPRSGPRVSGNYDYENFEEGREEPRSLVANLHFDPLNLEEQSFSTMQQQQFSALAPNTKRNIGFALKTFRRWLDDNGYAECREIHEIPPLKLDSYLADFYQGIRKSDGGDYSYKCLKALKTHLSRHLKNMGYPCCLTTSPVFSKSETMLKMRLQVLKAAPLILQFNETVQRGNESPGLVNTEATLAKECE